MGIFYILFKYHVYSYIAGVFCAIVSHPADTMVSKINAKKMDGSLAQNAGKIYAEIGFAGLWSGYFLAIILNLNIHNNNLDWEQEF